MKDEKCMRRKPELKPLERKEEWKVKCVIRTKRYKAGENERIGGIKRKITKLLEHCVSVSIKFQ
jgi:hypothetical protein